MGNGSLVFRLRLSYGSSGYEASHNNWLLIASDLERHIVEFASLCRRCWIGHLIGPLVTPGAKHLQFCGRNVEAESLLDVTVFIRPTAQSSLDVHLSSLGQILIRYLCESVPAVNSEPLSLFPILAFLAPIATSDGETEVGNRCTAWGIAHLRVSAEITDKDYLVDSSHDLLLLNL